MSWRPSPPLLSVRPEPLPPRLRASLPPEMRGLRRDHVKLLVADAGTGSITHSRFDRLGSFLSAGDLLVLNTSRTLPAGVPARRADGTPVQLRPAVRRPGSWDVLSVEPCPPHRNIPLQEGEHLTIGSGLAATVVGRRHDIRMLWRIDIASDGLEEMVSNGEPIRYSYVPRPVPIDYYQTVYAGIPGSAEMPSAGRPLSWDLLQRLKDQGVSTANILLHTGISSYQDDDFDAEHHLFEEWFEVPQATVDAVAAATRVIAVGTTVVRALETAGRGGTLAAARGWTELRLGAGSRLGVVDGMITGLHEPEASHFELLSAFLDDDLLLRSYREAVSHEYLFHEFGDSMLVLGLH